MTMQKINLTVDDFTDKMLVLMAMEFGCSRSEIVRNLVKARVKNDKGVLKRYSDIIRKS
jgi:hypothetical protein